MNALLVALMLAAPTAENPKPAASDAPLGVSALPDKADLESLLPKAAEPVPCAADMSTFKPVPTPVDEPTIVTWTDAEGKAHKWTMLPGLLISECGAVDSINKATKLERLEAELGALTRLRDREWQLWHGVELQYQRNTLALETALQDATTPSLWDTIEPYFWFGAGVLVTGGVIYGAVQVVEARN